MASTETLIEYLLDKGDIDSLIHVGGHHGEDGVPTRPRGGPGGGGRR